MLPLKCAAQLIVSAEADLINLFVKNDRLSLLSRSYITPRPRVCLLAC